jgi:hypothetical protein
MVKRRRIYRKTRRLLLNLLFTGIPYGPANIGIAIPSFWLWIGPDGYNGYSIEPAVIQVTSAGLSGGNLNVGSIGPAVNLAAITLSGTLTVTLDGQPVPHVQISASSGVGVYGCTGLVSPGSNAPWTMLLPVFDSPTNILYYVIGYPDKHWNVSERHFDKAVGTVSTYNTNITVPAINLGNITGK